MAINFAAAASLIAWKFYHFWDAVFPENCQCWVPSKSQHWTGLINQIRHISPSARWMHSHRPPWHSNDICMHSSQPLSIQQTGSRKSLYRDVTLRLWHCMSVDKWLNWGWWKVRQKCSENCGSSQGRDFSRSAQPSSLEYAVIKRSHTIGSGYFKLTKSSYYFTWYSVPPNGHITKSIMVR